MGACPVTVRIAACLAPVFVGVILPLARADAPSRPSRTAVQLAKAAGSYGSTAGSHKTKEEGSEDEPVWSHSSDVKVPGRFKSSPSGYNPERVQRFWRHYRGAKPRPEDKPQRPKEAK